MTRSKGRVPARGWPRAAAPLAAVLSAALLLASVAGCERVRSVTAGMRSTAAFRPLPGEPRILCQPGGERIAPQVAAYLPTAIGIVESRQCGRFPAPVRVYLCADMESFTRFTGTHVGGGVVLFGKLFLSPKLATTPERIPRILTHELSHLNLEQRIGVWKFGLGLPAWFKEGLATFVADGGGAERVSEAEARAAILAGRQIDPEASDNLLFPQAADKYRMVPHMFYRQSAMFVGYLARQDSTRFREFLGLLRSRDRFGLVFKRAFGRSIAEEWSGFVAGLRAAPPRAADSAHAP